MLRSLLITACLLFTPAVAHAQRVYTPSPIDLDDRVTALEKDHDSLSEAMEKIVVKTVDQNSELIKQNARMVSVLERIADKLDAPPAPARVVESVQASPKISPIPDPVPNKVTIQRATGPVSNGYYDGTSQWTYPGDIASHVAGHHGQNVSGMTKDQMEALHDSLHNAERSGRTVTRTVQRASGCPDGVSCPYHSSTYSRSVQSSGGYGPFGLVKWR